MKIRSAFVYQETLYLITWNWMAYQVPYANFANSFGKMLFNISEKKIGEVFKRIDGYDSFWKSRDDCTNIYKLRTVREFIFFDGYKSVSERMCWFSF